MPDALIDIEVAYATAAQQAVVALSLNAGSTVAEAIAASGLLPQFPEISAAALHVGIFAQACGLNQPLKQGDRVEIYRPLRHDPKEARRQRANKK